MVEGQENRPVIWTETAERQLFAILEYWNNRNRSTAYSEKLLDAIWARIELIITHPLAWRKTTFRDTRLASLGHYSIVYKFDDDAIWVMALWDNRQDPSELYRLLKEQEPSSGDG